MSSIKGKKVIILDDDPFLLNMYSAKFSAEGLEVDSAGSGEELIKKLKEGAKPDLLLLDVVIPGLSGLETLAEIRKANLAAGAKIAMLTNQNSAEDVEKAKSLNVDGYLVKATSSPSELVEKIKEILGG